jgi:chemotaxis protein methyltransferase CheR
MKAALAETDLLGLPMSEGEFRRFAALVVRCCGISMGEMKFELLRTRLAKRVRALRMGSFRQYYEWVCSEPSGEELERLIDVVTTHKTEFFRESAHYAVLIDQLRNRTSSPGHRSPLRLWSAACSSGEEPYSMAMALAEGLGSATTFKILGTDISGPMLAAAQQGEYNLDRLAAIPQPYLTRYFEPVQGSGGTRHRAGAFLRQAVQYSRFNLNDPAAYVFRRPFDAILCRNVMIYFDRPTQERLVHQLSAQLAPGGLLFTGFSESLLGVRHGLATVSPSVYQKPRSWDASA